MRAPPRFNTCFLLSTWVSVVSHCTVILAGFWLHTDPAPRTPPKPVLDQGENAVTIVWSAAVPREPSPVKEPPPPAPDEVPLDEQVDEEEAAAPAEEQSPPGEPETELEAEPEPEPRTDTEIDAVAEGPAPAMSAEATPTSPAPSPTASVAAKRSTAVPSTGARALVPRDAPPAPLPEELREIVGEEAPAEGKPGVRAEPRLASRLAPRYPLRCRRRGHQGTVLLECRLDAAGNVVSARVASPAGCDRLDRAALEAIRQARFEPARVDGEPVAGTILLPVEFRLQ